MGALYKMTYVGADSAAFGVIYIGDDGVTGMDAGQGVYAGRITVTDRARGAVTISMKTGGRLVTGQVVPAGAVLNVQVDAPSDFGNGRPITVSVNGSPVQVVFEKISDIPIPGTGFTLNQSTLDGPDKLR